MGCPIPAPAGWVSSLNVPVRGSLSRPARGLVKGQATTPAVHIERVRQGKGPVEKSWRMPHNSPLDKPPQNPIFPPGTTNPKLRLANMAFVVARQFRGNNIEAIHYATIVVVDARGRITHALGDPEQPFMTRSSIKPFQVLPLLNSGAADRYGFTSRQLAIMCGSHNGSDDHRRIVMQNLEAAGNTPNLLQCGTHWPLQMQLEQDYPASGEDRDPVRHNCSGKHSGFLALARHIGQEPETYLDPDSELQTRVRHAIAAMTDYPADRLVPAVDGCSAPNYALPLYNLALGFMRLATLQGPDPTTTEALRRVREAMWAHPEMVSGKHRIDLDVMRSFPGNVVCKVGAEGVEGIGFADPPIGIALKIHDGAGRARPPVIVETLRQLGIIDNIARFPFLMNRERPQVSNNRDLLTGHIVADFKLRET